jgi:hypothetical protein
LLAAGAACVPYLSHVVDLTAREETLRNELSKTVRWSVNWGMKTLAVRVLDKDTITAADIDAFRLLHIEAAGKETRSAETWQAQLALVEAGAGFAVFGILDQTLVTAALFVVSKQHCFYGVSASKRELFDKPIGHAIVWSAMMHAKNALGIRFFETGEQRFPGLSAAEPSAKELGIGFFKRSFGGETEVCLDLVLNPAQRTASK